MDFDGESAYVAPERFGWRAPTPDDGHWAISELREQLDATTCRLRHAQEAHASLTARMAKLEQVLDYICQHGQVPDVADLSEEAWQQRNDALDRLMDAQWAADYADEPIPA